MYEEIKDENDPKEDFEFEEQAKLYLASFQAMKEKYQRILLKQSLVSPFDCHFHFNWKLTLL